MCVKYVYNHVDAELEQKTRHLDSKCILLIDYYLGCTTEDT